MVRAPGSIQLALQLQAASLSVLWLQLLGLSQAQPATLVALPLLVVLRLWAPAPLQRHRRLWSNGVGLLLIGATLATTPLGDRSLWLAGMANLLWLLSGCKLLEVERPGAIRRSGLLLLVAIGMAGVFGQNLAPSLLQGAAALLALGSLLGLEMGAASRSGLLRRLLLLVGVSLPLMAALFVLGPRAVPYFQLQGGGASTGLSDQLDPGSIASLVRSDGPAMQLRFEGMGPPPPAERYWRVLTLNQFDGRRWRASPAPPRLAPATPPQLAGQQPALLVLLEPTRLRWLPWGGSGLPLPATVRRSADGGLWQDQPVRSRSLYRLVEAGASAEQPWREVPPDGADLAIPAATNPRLLELAASWRQLPSPAARVGAAQQWFLGQGFRYTLEPGPLPARNGLDVFLFERREGFCEHFAAAFTALMRAANVPARVVVGYQGGDWVQPVGSGAGHLTVTQADAHAWSEVWLPNRGWTRVDPTAWVVPSRVEQNLYESLGAAGSSDDQQLLRQPPGWLQRLRGEWEALDLGWNLWVMQLDQARQEALLRQLLGSNASRWQGALLIASLAALLLAALVVLSWLQPRAQHQRRRQLDRCLRRLGVTPRPGESLQTCLQRPQDQRPELVAALQELAASYSALQFAPQAPSTKAIALERKRWRRTLRQLARAPRRRYNPSNPPA